VARATKVFFSNRSERTKKTPACTPLSRLCIQEAQHARIERTWRDRHLNFTPEEAAAWLGEVREVRPHAPGAGADDDDAMIGVFGFVVILVILAFIGASYYGSAPRQIASNASRTSAQPRKAITKRTSTARAPRRGAAAGVTNALYINNQEFQDAYLPATWSMGCLSQDQPLFDSINGSRIGTIKKGTRLLAQIENFGDWRLVVAADGSFFGYMCIRWLNGVPERTPMRPEYAEAVAIIHRLESGLSPREQ
jgi:hypothetical protein